MKQSSSWLKPRHAFVQKILYCLLYPVARLKFGAKIEKFKEQEKRPYLILYNHQTVFDQFFVGMSFSGPIYYMATEDIFSLGRISAVIRYLVAPIPIKKQALDFRAVKRCIQIAKEGGTIAMAPEGNRTYSGKTEYINPAIAPLAKRLGLPIVLYRIEGGYGVQPRWSDVIRKGKMRAYVSRVIRPEEYAAMSDDALYTLIRDGLYVNEATADAQFYHKKRAQYLERLLYVCPFCGLSRFESRGAQVTCRLCERRVLYGTDKSIRGVGFDLPFRFVNDWYEYQKQFISALDLSSYDDVPLYEDIVSLWEVLIEKRKRCLRKRATVRLYGNRITIDEDGNDPLILPFSEIQAISVLGRNKLNIYHGHQVYQMKGDKRFNAIKYVNICYRTKNLPDATTNGKFLGL